MDIDLTKWTASYQAVIRALRVLVAGIVAIALTSVVDVVGAVDWTQLGPYGPLVQSSVVLFLTGLLTGLGKLFREPTVPISALKAAASAPAETSAGDILASAEQGGHTVPV